MKIFIGCILTLTSGLFFLVGGLVAVKAKNKDKLNAFSVSLAFIIMLNLMIADLIPECIELLGNNKIIFKISFIFIFAFLGISILKILDMFIPDHHHEHHEENDNQEEHLGHKRHIGLLTLISITLHNLLEGFAIWGMSIQNLKIGIFICVSVALHNIPLGTHIFNSLDVKKNKWEIALLSLSSFIGGLIYLAIGELPNEILALTTSITLGMIIYIAFIELLPDIKVIKEKREAKIGFILGIIILGISIFI